MSNYSTEDLEQFETQAENPAAPKGLRQGARAGAGVASQNPDYSTSKLGQWATDPSIGMTGAAQSWFSGANQNGPANGWATPFIDSFFAQREEAAAEGTLGTFFERDGATGVVTWDHLGSDGETRFEYGDVYEAGKKVGNLYDIYGDDRDTANLMMSTFVLDKDEKKRVYDDAATDVKPGELRNPNLDRLLLERRASDAVEIPKALQAAAFQGDVTERAEDFQEGAVDEGIMAAGAAGGATIGAGAGAAVGAFFGGVGAAPGALIGGAVGGVAGGLGSFLNKDSLTEQAARAYEITSMSKEEFGLDAGVATGVTQWSRFGMKAFAPMSNLVQGGVDAYGQSEVGDGTADFYRVDKKGDRTVGKIAMGADLAATVGDSLLQFASPVGLATYSGLMAGTIGGQVAELGLTGGNTFDDRAGGFDNIFVDTDPVTGKQSFDPVSAAAGIGAIGIDVVQLGFARGLAGKTDDMIKQFGGDAAKTTYAGRIPRWLGGQAPAKAGETQVRMGGFMYTLDDAGTAVSRRATLSLLAPSEQLTSLSARVMARRHLAVSQGATTTDDIYRAANAMASGERKWTNTIVNAMGESYEEGLQSALEPISHDANLDAGEIYMAAAYGFAAGAGMTAATQLSLPSSHDILVSQAKVAYRMNSGGAEMTDAEVRAMSDDDLRLLAASVTPAQQALAKSASKAAVDALVAQNYAGVAGELKLLDAIRTTADANLAKANPRVDGSFVVTPLEAAGEVDADGNIAFGSIPSDALVSSASQMLTNLVKMKEGLDVQVDALTKDLTRADITADPELLAKATRDAEQATGMQAMLERVLVNVEARVAQINNGLDPIVRAADVASLNEQLRAWYTESDDTFEGVVLDPAAKRSLARAVSMVYARDPHDSSGSYPMLVPQVSLQLTAQGADNVIQVSSGILKAIRGDHDGDKLRPQNMLWLDEDAFANARSGAWYVGTGSAVHVDPPKEERYGIEAISLSLSKSGPLALEASAALTEIGDLIKKRYAGRAVDAQLDRIVDDFYAAVRANVPDARAILLDGLAGSTGSIVNEYAREHLSNEWLWIDQVVRAKLQRFQEAYVAHQPLPSREVDDLGLTPADAPKGLHRSRSATDKLGRRAATYGNTMGLLLVGDSPFRMFQKLHYSTLNSPVLSADAVTEDELTAMAEMYEMLGQNLTQTELERIQSGDSITGPVLLALEKMAADAQVQSQLAAQQNIVVNGIPVRTLSKHEALVVLAQMEVRDFNQDPATGQLTPGGTISLTQLLLKLQVQKDQRVNARILEAAPQLKAKHFRLLELTAPGGGNKNSPVNAEKAFVEVFGGQSLASLLGEEAAVFGPQITLEQYIRQFSALSPEARKMRKTELTKGNPAYLGRKSVKNIPYTQEEILEGDITPSRAIIDTILAVGSSRVSIETLDNGQKALTGEYAQRSARVSEDFREAHKVLRDALAELLKSQPKHEELTTELVARLMTQNPDFARKAYELIPNNQADVTFEVRDGQVYVRDWFFQMFAEKDSKKAEMILWRGILIDGWQARGVDADAVDDDTDGTGRGREYGKLKRRMHRVMYHVAPSKARDAGILQSLFLQELMKAENVDDFVMFVNTTPGLMFNEAPIVPWFDDVAEFDVDKANGGWTTSLEGAELREAIRNLRDSTGTMLADLAEERLIAEDDRRLIAEVERVIAQKKGNPSRQLDPNDTAVYDQLEAALDRAAELAVALGPHAMVFQSTANAWGFYGQAHNKGTNPAHVEALGMFDARRDAFGFVHNYSRVMGALTAVDIDAVGSNLNQVLKDSGRAMDDFGNIVEWGKPSVEDFVALMKDPATAQFARALVQPTVLERTDAGQLSEQLLLGKTLRSLISGQTYDDLFGKYGPDTLNHESAFKYLALVEAGAREFGGHSAVQRAVNDIVIARIQGARQTLTFEDVESLVTEAYFEVARVLQKVGALETTAKAQGADLLTDVRRTVKHDRRNAHKRGRLGELGADTESDAMIQLFQQEIEAQFTKDVADLTASITDANRDQVLARIERLTEENAEFTKNFERLLEGDEVAHVVSAMSLPTPGVLAPDEFDRRTAAVQRVLVQFIDDNPAIVDRVPSALLEIAKLQRQLSDPANYGEVDMTTDEWDTISRAVIGMMLADSAGPVGQGVSIRMFPGAKALDDRRYYDQSYSYLVDPLLDSKSALVQAAAKVHVMARRHGEIVTQDEVAYEINRSIFNEKKFGPWTEEVVTASVESNQRIDSSAAAQAVAMSGMSPKAEVTVSAATSRTFLMPGDELLSTVRLNSAALERGLFDEVEVTFPGGVTGFRPLAQLNNRFARSVVATLPDGSTVDLLADYPDLGRSWYGNAQQAPVQGSPVEVHLDRLAEAMTMCAKGKGLRPADLEIEVSFFHPDSQPEGPEWFNNLWFEGTSFKLDADRHPSLNETLWFSLGSLSPEGQAAALDAAKNGKQAMQVIRPPSAADRAEAELGFESDLAAVLRKKTKLALEIDLGFGALEPEMYNAVMKGQKLRHFLLVGDEVLTAEQVIARQAAGEVFADAQLWTPSDRVLRSMLGEQGSQGVPRVFDDQLEFDTTRVPPYRGITPTMMERFSEGLTGGRKELAETRIVHRGRQNQLRVRPMTPRKQRDQFAERYRRLAEAANEGWLDRTNTAPTAEGFNVKDNLTRAVQYAGKMLKAEDLSFLYESLGISFIGPRLPSDATLSKMVLKDLNALIENDGRRTGWILKSGATTSHIEGVLGEVPLDNPKRKGLRVLLGDLVVVDLASFGEGPESSELAKEQIRRLADKGATIVLGEMDGASDLRGEMAAYIRSLRYEPIIGSKHSFQPPESNSWYIQQQAREDTLTVVKGISPMNRVAVFNAEGIPMQEGGAFINDRTLDQNASVRVVSDLVPTSSMGGFGVPQRQVRNVDQIDQVIRSLRALDNPADQAALKKASKSQADPTFDRAWRRMMERFDDPENGVLPAQGTTFEIGDMIPLIDNAGRVILYRHGHKRPKLEDRKRQFNTVFPKRGDSGQGVAVYLPDPEPAATTHSGIVTAFRPRAGYGLSVELQVPLQAYGDKKQLQWDGTKYTIVPWPDASQPNAPVLPEHTFMRNRDIHLVSDIDTRLGKQGTESMVNNHRNAFAFFGIDFLGDLTEFFFPGQANSAEAKQMTTTLLRLIAQRGPQLSVRQVHQMMNAGKASSQYLDSLVEVANSMTTQAGLDATWLTKLESAAAPHEQISMAVLLYLSTPGARLEDVIRSGSFDDLTAGPDAQSILMPQLFTQLFDNATHGSPLRVEINRRLNAAINRQGAKPGESYRLTQGFDFITTAAGGRRMVGRLSFPEVHSSGDNPVTNGMSFQEGGRQQASSHSAMVADQAIGARTLTERGLQKAQAFKDAAFRRNDKVERFAPGVYDDGAVWRMLSDVPAKDRSATNMLWSQPLPSEIERRGLAYDAMVTYRKPIEKDPERWSTAETASYDKLAGDILSVLNLPQTMKTMVDGWVRQMSGRAHGMLVEGNEVEPLSGSKANEWLRDIMANVATGQMPTFGGYVPLTHLHDLKLIYRQNREASRPWAPVLGVETEDKAQSWDDWVHASLGSGLASDKTFEAYYLLPTDGFMHSYQNAIDELADLPVSLSVLETNRVLNLSTVELVDGVARAETAADNFLDPEYQLAASIDPRTTSLLTNPIVLDTTRMTIGDLMGGQRIAGEWRGESPPASAKAQQDARLRRHRKEKGMATPVPVSMKDFRENSTLFLHHTGTTNALTRGLINLRVGNALLNPSLYVSMPIELAIRSSLDTAANLLVGQSTSGPLAMQQAKLGQKLEGTKIGDLLGGLGMETSYTPEQIVKLRGLYKVMGSNPDFKGMVYGDLMYQRPYEPGKGRIDRFLEGYAKLGSKAQDPTYGMRADALGRRYLEPALQHIMRSGTLNAISVDQLIAELQADPLFLKKRMPDAHAAGTNNIAQIRSLKATPLTLMLRWVYEPLSMNAKSPAANMFGNLVLRMPMLFAGYAGNVATTLLGLQGLSDLSAAFVDGRKKGPLNIFGRIAAVMRGDEFDPSIDAEFDMSSVIEGIDLSRSFIRGGLTHTGLFTFAMMAGGLGLSGEDDEAKRMRRAAELQGAGHVYDPRKIENDFRNADALFLDWLPFGFDSMFKNDSGRAMANTHWMLKQFISPIIGIEKFIETGNFNHVKWGFIDALGAFPLINTNTVTDTFETMAVFEQQAADLALEGTDEAQVKAAGLLTSIVGSYEKMLFENSFLSGLYINSDEFDRDPYAKVMLDSDGDIQRDALGLPRQTEKLMDFIDPNTGEAATGYQARSGLSSGLAVLTEKRLTMALVSSLFTGLGDSEYIRHNMVPKIRDIEKPHVSRKMAEALLLTSYAGTSGMRNISVDEAEKIIKAQYRARGEWYEPDEVAIQARALSAQSGGAGMSKILGAREVLTEAGAKAIFNGLFRGSLKFGDQSLKGTYVTYEMREQISADFLKEFTAEGVAMGLDQSSAVSRAKRLMSGSFTNPDSVGLADLIFSKEISYSDKSEFYQLNTTYVMGPDGRPWATGYARPSTKSLTGVLQQIGVLPLASMLGAGSGGVGQDEVLNTVDLLGGMNTGLRALVQRPEVVPTDEEIGKAIEKAIAEAAQGNYTPFTPYASTKSGGYGYTPWKNYGGYKRRSYGGGSYSSSGYPNFTRMYTMPEGESPYGNNAPFINTSNPILRRGDVRRERVWSERGRLNQWQ